MRLIMRQNFLMPFYVYKNIDGKYLTLLLLMLFIRCYEIFMMLS